MTTNTAQKSRPWSLASYFGVAAAVLAGIAGGALAVVVTVFLMFEAGGGWFGRFVVFTVFMAIPVIACWAIRNRYARGLAAGLTALWVTIGLAVLWQPWTTMSSGEIEEATAEIVATGAPAYYFGVQADGYALNDYYQDNSQVNFFYGECHGDDFDEGGCSRWDVSMGTEAVSRGGVSITGDARCRQLEPVLSVPTVRAHNEVVMFVDESMIGIEYRAASHDLEKTLALARTLRPVGQADVTALTSPPASTVTFIEEHCKPAS